MRREIPYTSDDLRYLADKIDKVMEVIGDDTEIPDDDWRWGLTVDIQDDGGDVAGQLRAYGDGWIGFYPQGIVS